MTPTENPSSRALRAAPSMASRRLPIKWNTASASRTSSGFGLSSISPQAPRSSVSRAAGGREPTSSAARQIARASANVVGSGVVGPDPMTAGSSGAGSTTSDMARVTMRPRAATASRPPFIADRCFRTQLSPSIATPARSRTAVVADLSSRVKPAIGAARPAEAPPDSRSTRISSGARPAARASARLPAATLPAVGTGCPTSNHSRLPTGPPGCGEAISPVAPARGTADTKADAISAAAFPAATTTGLRPAISPAIAPLRSAWPTSSEAPAAAMPPRTISRA